MDAEGRRYLVTREGHHSPVAADNESHLGWRSPAMCLFFGMASVLALVGCAWIILVCIACRLVGANLGRGTLQVSLESMASAHIKPEVICSHDQEQNEKVLVIMPGEQKPTFLGTQLSCVGPSTENRVL